MGWVEYSDIGIVYEISAVYDDVLKKNKIFIDYAVKVANCILEDLGIKALATWGKWGARLEPEVNPTFSKRELETIAYRIINHPSWKALKESTHVFTYGDNSNEVLEYQTDAEERAEATQKKATAYLDNILKTSCNKTVTKEKKQ